MRYFWLLLTYFAFRSNNKVDAVGELTIHPSTPGCETKGTTLVCEFNNAQQTALIGDLSRGKTSTITKIYIHNIKRVQIERSNCIDLAFYNVEDVHFSDTSNCRKKVTSLWLYDSHANAVPLQLNRLEITRSKVDKLSCELGLQRLFISNSVIKEFNAPWPISGQVILKIEDSTVDRLISLKLEANAQLVVMNSTINHIVTGGVSLGQGASASIIRSIVSSEEKSIHVHSGSKFLVRDVEGRVSTYGGDSIKKKYDTKRPPGVPQNPTVVVTPEESKSHQVDDSCKQNISNWAWFFPTVMATVEALVLIILCSQKYQRKPKKPQIPLEEDSEFGTGIYNQKYNDSVQHYYNESHVGPQMYRKRL